jgi:hypothetical protein
MDVGNEFLSTVTVGARRLPGLLRAWLAGIGLSAALICAAGAQNVIRHGGWEGFATRDNDGKFDRCVLYNRTIELLTASPSNMLGLTEDAKGSVGLMVFFEPRTLVRSESSAILVRIDQGAPVRLPAAILSDFHAVTTGNFDAATIAALRAAKTIEVTVEKNMLRFELADPAGVLDGLQACVSENSG